MKYKHKELYAPGAILAGAVLISASIIYGTAGMSQGISSPQGGAPTTTSRVQNNGSTVDFTIGPDDHVRGNPNASVTLVEFSDLECPFCRQFHPTVLQALDEFPNQVRWVYKHFPLDAIHPQARPAAEASECVWEQKGDEGFWTFADRMFEEQERLGAAFYREVAQELGVNLAQFDDCVSTRKYRDKVEQDYQQGIQGGVTGTPGSYVNGTPVRGAIPYSQLKTIIESHL